MRVLVVEDSSVLQNVIVTALRKSGFAVDATGDGLEGLWMATNNSYDVILLDIMLPGMSGLEVLGQLRAKQLATHILLLTAKGSLHDRVTGLDHGADDYLIKPFALEELLARVHALCRRSYGNKTAQLLIGDLQIDLQGKKVSRAGQPLEITAREFALLEYLAQRAGQVVTRSEIEAHIYDEQVEPMSNVVDAAIYALRKKLCSVNPAPLIHTRRGLGYVLEAPHA